MEYPDVVFGLVVPDSTEGSEGSESSGDTLREFTLAWSRFVYRGPVVEGKTAGQVLRRAADSGARYCVLQRAGHVLIDSHDVRTATVVDEILGLVKRSDVALAGHPDDASDDRGGLSDRLIVVDLERLRRLGLLNAKANADTSASSTGASIRVAAHSAVGIDLGEVIESCRRARLRFADISHLVVDRTLDLRGPATTEASFANLRGQPIPTGDRLGHLTKDQRDFLEVIRDQAAYARQGVFLSNLEPYADVVIGGDAGRQPVTTLYSVASGFKPNMLLHVHGFTDATRVVFFDYSRQALAIRRWLVQQWDGTDFPAAVKRLVDEFPPPGTYFQTPGRGRSAPLTTEAVESTWARELAGWGGAEAFRLHWERYRTLSHEYVYCDLLSDPMPLLWAVRDDPGVIWWSNAFFTLHGIWFHAAGERRERFEQFITSLADAAPEVRLYGSDDNNSCINCVTAGDYRQRYALAGVSDVRPFFGGRIQIRI